MIDAQIKTFDLILRLPLDKTMTLEKADEFKKYVEEAAEMAINDFNQTELDKPVSDS